MKSITELTAVEFMEYLETSIWNICADCEKDPLDPYIAAKNYETLLQRANGLKHSVPVTE